MEYRLLLAAALFFFVVTPVYAGPISTELKGVYDSIVCNMACFIEYVILAISAVVIVLSGFRYMTSDDPGVRHSMKSYIMYAMVGLVLVLIALPALNMFVEGSQQGLTKKVFASFNCACTPHHQIKEFFDAVSCRVICLFEYVAAFVAALIILVAALRYMSSGDPHLRAVMRGWVINALVGLLFLGIAIPALNYVTGGAISPLNCDCTNLGSYSFVIGGTTSKYVAGEACTGTDCPCRENPDKLCCAGGKWTADAAKYGQLCQIIVIKSACDDKCNYVCGEGMNMKTCKQQEKCKTCPGGCCCTYDPTCTAKVGLTLGSFQGRSESSVPYSTVYATLSNGYVNSAGASVLCEKCGLDWGGVDGPKQVDSASTSEKNFYPGNGDYTVSYGCLCDTVTVSAAAKVSVNAPVPNPTTKLKFVFVQLGSWNSLSFTDKANEVANLIKTLTPLKNCPAKVEFSTTDKQCAITIPATDAECSAGAFQEKLMETIKACGKDKTSDATYFIGMEDLSTCGGEIGGFDWPGSGVVYTQGAAEPDMPYYALHELGHGWGLNDEYRDTCRCFPHDANSKANCLDALIGGGDASESKWTGYCAGGTLCSSNRDDGTCFGNKDPAGGRCIMSAANAPGPRAFCQKCMDYLSTLPALQC